MKYKPGLIGIFANRDSLQAALKVLKNSNTAIKAVYSPVPLHEIEAVLSPKPSLVRYFTLSGALLGIITGIFLSVYTSVQWNFIVSGKPVISYAPMVIVAFEFCILLAIIFNLLGMLINSRLPQLNIPMHYDPRFTADRFGILVQCSESEQVTVTKILKQAGAEEVHDATG
jgi:molybdopterin-containing oxidoreductase family membrane subunit